MKLEWKIILTGCICFRFPVERQNNLNNSLAKGLVGNAVLAAIKIPGFCTRQDKMIRAI